MSLYNFGTAARPINKLNTELVAMWDNTRTDPATVADQTRPDTGLPLAAMYFAACDAQSWIGEHADKWLHGSATDPGYHYPMAVLTIAHGEARYLVRVA